MKPYKHIEDSKKVLKTLISEAKTMDNVPTRLKELNIIIKMLNSYEEMLKNKYHTDFFDLLILSRMYQTLIKSNKEININEFLLYIDEDFRVGKEFLKENIISFLQGIQVSNSIKKGVVYADTNETWATVIDNLIKQIKTKIIWNKKWKK